MKCTLVRHWGSVQAVRPIGGSRGTVLLFLDHGTRRGEGSALRPGRSLPPGKTRYPLYRRLDGPQGRSGKARRISPPPGFSPRNVQPQASRYTNWATGPTHQCNRTVVICTYLNTRHEGHSLRTEWQQACLEFRLLLVSLSLQFWFVSVAPKRSSLATFSRVLAVFVIVFPAFCGQDMNSSIVFSAFNSRPVSLLATKKKWFGVYGVCVFTKIN